MSAAPRTRRTIGVLLWACLWVLADRQAAFAWNPAPLSLGEVLFIHDGGDRDRDRDGLRDDFEYRLALEYLPVLVFDSSENHRRGNEPVTLFQVRAAGCIGEGCPHGAGGELLLRYVFLFQTDGGYGPSSDCKDAHNGDNQGVDIWLRSADGRTWDISRIDNSAFHTSRPTDSPVGTEERHVAIFMSAHKHHQYFGTSNDEKNSVYSKYGCNDDVNGRGARIIPPIESEICQKVSVNGQIGHVACSRIPHNAGEPEAHAAPHFVNDLDSFGFHGESAWSDRPFKGGLRDDGKDTSSIGGMWSQATFSRSSGFARYIGIERLLGSLQVPLFSR